MILFLDLNGSLISKDLIYYFEKAGRKCKFIQYILSDKENDNEFEAFLTRELTCNRLEFVFSTNYYPVVARVCHDLDVIYVSWTYDSPPDIFSLDTMDFSTNRLFFFSKYEYKKYRAEGLENVYYMPLAVNTNRLDTISASKKYKCDVALVGGLYRSDSYNALTNIMSVEQKKYLEAVVAVQQTHSGSFVVDSSLTDEFVASVCSYYLSQSATAVQPTKEQLFFSICSHLTHMDRLSLLRLSSRCGYDTRLYLSDISDFDRSLLRDYPVKLCSSVNYEHASIQVFKSTKINLNPTLRANRTGIPLRVVDVLGSCSFLLTTHQPELDDFFGTDEIVYYETTEDAIDKIKYYIEHDSERRHITENGYLKAKNDFNYPSRVRQILEKIEK